MEHFQLVGRLHTDVLEDKYGPISVRVVKHTNLMREAHLVDKKGISRTYSLTFFPKKRNASIASVEKDIARGAAIGKAFRLHGYSVRKNVIEVFILALPKWLQKSFKTKEFFAKARLSEFYAKKEGENPVIYGTVLEVYTPDFRDPVINTADLLQDNALTEMLERVGFSKLDIWNRLGKDNYWADVQKRYMHAKRMSLVKEFDLKFKISTLLTRHR